MASPTLKEEECKNVKAYLLKNFYSSGNAIRNYITSKALVQAFPQLWKGCSNEKEKRTLLKTCIDQLNAEVKMDFKVGICIICLDDACGARLTTKGEAFLKMWNRGAFEENTSLAMALQRYKNHQNPPAPAAPAPASAPATQPGPVGREAAVGMTTQQPPAKGTARPPALMTTRPKPLVPVEAPWAKAKAAKTEADTAAAPPVSLPPGSSAPAAAAPSESPGFRPPPGLAPLPPLPQSRPPPPPMAPRQATHPSTPLPARPDVVPAWPYGTEATQKKEGQKLQQKQEEAEEEDVSTTVTPPSARAHSRPSPPPLPPAAVPCSASSTSCPLSTSASTSTSACVSPAATDVLVSFGCGASLKTDTCLGHPVDADDEEESKDQNDDDDSEEDAVKDWIHFEVIEEEANENESDRDEEEEEEQDDDDVEAEEEEQQEQDAEQDEQEAESNPIPINIANEGSSVDDSSSWSSINRNKIAPVSSTVTQLKPAAWLALPSEQDEVNMIGGSEEHDFESQETAGPAFFTIYSDGDLEEDEEEEAEEEEEEDVKQEEAHGQNPDQKPATSFCQECEHLLEDGLNKLREGDAASTLEQLKKVMEFFQTGKVEVNRAPSLATINTNTAWSSEASSLSTWHIDSEAADASRLCERREARATRGHVGSGSGSSGSSSSSSSSDSEIGNNNNNKKKQSNERSKNISEMFGSLGNFQ
eukprot:CAMPEP_0206526966 /NCGR_PEP_ID=MMETSP0325_2-20121206/1056_1 /ASSEMBLY_ACC=CAM_ASM_000347 /TAXON_ID=2866 /ORGANISM="Crypthecodinium cohnii, Strain Seligo" /LENGTH=701 /DNA_ID=CAMNT_0054022263 /DNA_START=195 /DNA_END=2300 /DNA_ORIENTATION=+